MKYIAWDPEKNKKLKEKRRVSFEAVVDAIFEGNVIAKTVHPNQQRYPGQQMFLVEIEDYVFIVPFVEDKEKLFFKTIFPSRKYTKKIIEKGGL